MKIKKIIYKLSHIFFQIVKNKYGLTFLLIFIVFHLGMIAFIFYYNLITLKGLMTLILFIMLSIFISECAIYLLIKYNVTFFRFSYFLNLIYKKETTERLPSKEALPNLHYYIGHPFYNFTPRPSHELHSNNIEINSLGFRGQEKNWKDPKNYYIYLSGDCQFFEEHLKLKDTFGYILEFDMKKRSGKEVVIVNAGCSHYTLLHALNRLIIDLNRIRFHLIILCGGTNDVLAFVHSKNGKAHPDYTNLYKSFSEKSIMDEFQKAPVRYSKFLQLCKYMQKRNILRLDNNIITMNPDYDTDDNINRAKKIFTTSYFENYLRMYINICKAFHIPLMLSTANYNPVDMKGPARTFVAYGIDKINLITKKMADEFNLPIFDYQKEFIPNPDRIFNKWHYTKEGNELRAELNSKFIQQHFSLFI